MRGEWNLVNCYCRHFQSHLLWCIIKLSNFGPGRVTWKTMPSRCLKTLTFCVVKKSSLFNWRCQENLCILQNLCRTQASVLLTYWRYTGPMHRISIDFNWPLPTAICNRYLLVIVDEYSWFPFLYTCTDMQTSTVKNYLELLFSMSGMPDYIDSDWQQSIICLYQTSRRMRINCVSSRFGSISC